MSVPSIQKDTDQVKRNQPKNVSSQATRMNETVADTSLVKDENPLVFVHEVLELQDGIYEEEYVDHIPQTQQNWSGLERLIVYYTHEAKRNREHVKYVPKQYATAPYFPDRVGLGQVSTTENTLYKEQQAWVLPKRAIGMTMPLKTT
jgi:hypothetical protein